MSVVLLLIAAASAQDASPPPPVGGALQTLNPDLAVVLDVALAGFSSDEPLQTGAHDPRVDGFTLQQLELSVGKAVDPYFRLDGNLVFSPYGVEIEEIYATTLSLPLRTQLRVGQFLTRFGRMNPTHPHSWAFVDQPFALGRVFGGEGNRGVGLEGSILLPLPWSVELVVSETMAGGEATARSFYGPTDLGVDRITDLQTTIAAKQFFGLSADTGLLWGLSWAGGPNPTGRSNRTELYGTDVYLKWRPVSQARATELALQAEVIYRRYQVPSDVLTDTSGYAQVVWRFLPRFSVGGRYEYGSATHDLDGEIVAHPLDPAWTDDRHRLSAALTLFPTEFSRIRLQGAADRAEWRDAPDYAAFLAFEFVAGAHGAHTF